MSANADQAKAFAEWRFHPAQMVRQLFRVEPDAWQEKVLEEFPHNPLQAMIACKGPGKTTVLAWLCWNFLLTRYMPNIGAVSITSKNLEDGLWKEMSKWHGVAPLLKSTFTITSERIFANDFPKTWFMSAKSYKQNANAEEQAGTLAGFHADFIMFVLDESGDMSDAVMVAAEAALSSCKEGHIIQAGNPTKLSGPLYRAATRDRRRWSVTEITGDPDDPMRSPRVSVEWAKEQITTYGADNPWVLVNVFGRFPPSSLNVLIGVDEVLTAMKRRYTAYDIGPSPRIMGVDVARFGDDASVIARRHGIQMLPFKRQRNIDSLIGAGWVGRNEEDWSADAVFVDNTGGHGAGWVDQLRQLGRSPIGILFSSKAHEPRYYNKRSEMYFDFVQWIKDGGALPESPDLLAALTQTTYTFKLDKLLLEDKALVKAKLGYSPDDADAAVLTFAEPVVARHSMRAKPRHDVAYDPFREMNLRDTVKHSYEYDPYQGS